MIEFCPTCNQPLPKVPRGLTPRELQVLLAWWTTGSVVEAAKQVGVGRQRLSRLVTHPHAAVPVTLHSRSLLRSQQGIGDEPVLVEDRVVIAGHVCFGRPHSLLRGSVA